MAADLLLQQHHRLDLRYHYGGENYLLNGHPAEGKAAGNWTEAISWLS